MFIIREFEDEDFAGDNLTRRSRSGFLIMLNSAPLFWFSKKQLSMVTNSFGSKFVAIRQCCEYLKGLYSKLRTMGFLYIIHVLSAGIINQSYGIQQCLIQC